MPLDLTALAGCIETKARELWNAQADQFNQWDALGQDEKDELIRRVRTAKEQMDG